MTTTNNEVKNFENEAKAFYTDSINNEVNGILSKHGLDFRMEKMPLFAKTPSDRLIPSEFFGLVNTKLDKMIGTCKGSYTISQNDDVVRAVLLGMKPFGDKLTVTKAGSINEGRRTFIQLGVDGVSKVGDDVIRKYVTITDSNDGSSGLSVGIGNLTASCTNQFYRFYKAGQSKYMHTISIMKKIQELPELINLALSESLQMIEVFNRFRSTVASKELANEMVKELTGINYATDFAKDETSQKAINSMNTLYTHIAKETAGKGNSIWGLFSGCTSWTTHAKSHPVRENGQIESIMMGTNYATNQKALNFCMNKANVNADLILA